MSKALSLKLDDSIFEEAENLLKKIRIPRNAFINQAVAFYTKLQKKVLMQKRLKKEAELLKQETAAFMKDFELLEDLPE